jgi:hypothetical protein
MVRGFLCALMMSGCGDTVRPLAVLVNQANVTKEAVGLEGRDPSAPMPVDSFVRMANVVGDAAVDQVSPLPQGKGLEIRDGSSGRVLRLPTTEYLTDVAVVRDPGSIVDAVVVLTSPNANGGGTYSVFALPELTPRVVWQEERVVSRLGTGVWNREPAIFYLRADAIAVRAADGRLLTEVAVPGAQAFSRVFTAPLGGDRTVILASGDGYTPFHMVAVFDGRSTLLFHEQAAEHAWRLAVAPDGKSFDVDTRTKRWRYKTS